ncbi:twin-arginine translocation pathway signal protein [Alsobacter soli]|uniref:Twin-arginine translocation pathway signal protein n=1 Tax=Alsobacter soli TaxID=2109933 RepID=A0A2T1HWR4_9HYPH|nr:gluconate 2-dehydrogenase subunit 3 family protein [Alsobacter soli]PSC05949.1 twin-arginine translocation pathway signal protein [Alsobacter soli]
MEKIALSRRQILAGGAAAAVVATERPASAHSIKGEVPWAPSQADAPHAIDPGGYIFFTPQEAALIEAAVARLIPADDLGPGAKELGVPTFLDRQLAGEYGRAERWYMLGPWRQGSDNQGYQSRLTPAQLYRYAIKQLDAHVSSIKDGRRFANLATEDQDALLSDLEAGKVDLGGVSGKAFFDLLLQNTIEGFFADPIYGGNRNMEAWRMIGFPGARYDYRDFVAKHGERFPLPPVGLQGRPAWSSKG